MPIDKNYSKIKIVFTYDTSIAVFVYLIRGLLALFSLGIPLSFLARVCMVLLDLIL